MNLGDLPVILRVNWGNWEVEGGANMPIIFLKLLLIITQVKDAQLHSQINPNHTH